MFCRRIRCQCRKYVPQIVYGTSLYNILILAFGKRKNGISHRFIRNRFPCIAIDRSQFRFAKCRRKRLVVLSFKPSLYAKQSDCQFLSYIFALLHSSGKSIEFRLSQTVAVDAFFTGRKFVQIAILKKDIAEVLDLIPGKRSLCQIRCQILLQKCLFLIGQRDLLLRLLLVDGILQGFGKTVQPAGKYPFAQQLHTAVFPAEIVRAFKGCGDQIGIQLLRDRKMLQPLRKFLLRCGQVELGLHLCKCCLDHVLMLQKRICCR